MGKRELLIALAFIAAGVVTYEVTAPPPKPGEGFSFARFFNNTRRRVQSDTSQATTTRGGTIVVSAELREVRIARVSRLVRVIGEARPDIRYDLTVDAAGPDQATALERANLAALGQDDMGSSLALTVSAAPQGRQSSQLTLHVPARLTVRIDGTAGATVDVTGVRGLRLEGVAGEATIRMIAGAVTGLYRSGSLTVTGAESIDLIVQNATATFEQVHGPTDLTIRTGRCRLLEPGGPVEVDATSADLTIDRPADTAHVVGNGGHVTISDPRQEISVDMRRTEIGVTLSTAVASTLITSDAELRLTLPDHLSLALDAAASDGGAIRADDFGLLAETRDQVLHLAHTFGAGGPRVVLRNQRAQIVIARTK